MTSFDVAILLAALTAVVLFSAPVLRARSQAAKLPPGPPGHWFFGNKLPPALAHLYYTDLGKTYGPVFTLRYGSRIVCVITGHQAAIDIMVKQSHALSDRPRFVAAGELISAGMRILLVGAGARLRRLRAALHTALQPASAAIYEPIQTKAARRFVLDLLEKPGAHIEHARRYAASVIMTVTYGKTTTTSYADEEVQQIERTISRLGGALLPGAYAVDKLPFLKHIPWFTNELRQFHRDELTLYQKQVHGVREKLAKNDMQPCFVTYLLDNQEKLQLDNDELAYLAGSMFGAGSDTTAAALSFMLMASALHPEAQSRVQAQLDAVVGRDRAPTFDDRDALSEVWAYVEEGYRWRPVASQGFSHRATQDIIWSGYHIPIGTEILACHWAIARDSEVYKDADHFRPERWIDENGRLRDDLKFFNWGFGRRICPGNHLAERSLFINTALVLWAFDITEDLKHPIDSLAIKDGALVHPHPFVVHLKPRIKNLREKLHAGEDL